MVHPADEPSYLRELTGEEAALLAQSEEQSDTYSELWQTFFSATAISQRKNPACQRTPFSAVDAPATPRSSDSRRCA